MDLPIGSIMDVFGLLDFGVLGTKQIVNDTYHEYPENSSLSTCEE
jgi:hypothetical protein